jgi:hypothetical protein
MSCSPAINSQHCQVQQCQPERCKRPCPPALNPRPLAARVQLDEQLHHTMVEVLDEAASRQLFRQSAGLRGDPEAALQKVEAAILAACGGLPLAVRLMGGQLYKIKDEAVWKVMLGASMFCWVDGRS